MNELFSFLTSAIKRTEEMTNELILRDRGRAQNVPQDLAVRTIAAVVTNSQAEYNSTEDFEIGINLLRFNKHSRPTLYAEVWIERYCEDDFHRLFRVRKETFHLLIQVIMESNVYKTERGHGLEPLSIDKKTLIALSYMATTISIRKIGDNFNVSDSSALKAIDDFCQVMLEVKDRFIQWPTEDECRVIEAQFGSLAGFPGVIGAIDGCHIEAKFSKEFANHWTDRKMSKTMVLQGICTAKKLLTNVYIGASGKNHDARVLQRSNIFKTIDACGRLSKLFKDEYHIIGDSAYPLKPWLLVPFKNHGNITRTEKKYNTHLSKTRVVIENVFGQLKGRWRRLKYIDVQTPKKIALRINAACVLHNFCLLQDDVIEDILNHNPEDEPVSDLLDPDLRPQNIQEFEDGSIKRNSIKDFLNS